MRRIALWLGLLLWAGVLAMPGHAAGTAATEEQVKAVFVFNFSQFVEWPADAFSSAAAPFVIGVLGSEAMAVYLEEAVRGERIDRRPLEVRRIGSLDDIGNCQILFIANGQGAQVERVLSRLSQRHTLTVSDIENATRRGVMIQFAKRDNRIRLLINVESARSAGLTISSNLLRPAEIVRTDSTEQR